MARRLNLISTIVVIAVLAGVLWVFGSNILRAGGDASTPSPVAAAQRSAGEVLTQVQGITPRTRGAVIARNIAIAPNGLAIPVDGIRPEQLSDTFDDARGGGSRTHRAIDIMAPEGTPVVAAAAGTVEKLFNSVGKGGLTAYVRSEDQKWTFYYAHLQVYAEGLVEGQKIARGTPIGLVGHTGDASPDGPHLHFAINRMAPGERWWQGEPINPYPLLAGK
ncbi:MAG: M23 family metallopeptidase [Sphingomicrobium sp.]